jgi:hypothetical protein
VGVVGDQAGYVGGFKPVLVVVRRDGPVVDPCRPTGNVGRVE